MKGMFRNSERDYLSVAQVKINPDSGCTIVLTGTNYYGDAVNLRLKSTDVPSEALSSAVEKLGKAIFDASEFSAEALQEVRSVKFDSDESGERETVEVIGLRQCSNVDGTAEIRFSPQFIGGRSAQAAITQTAVDVRKLAGEYAFGDRPGNLFREDWAEEPIGSDTQE